MENKFPISTFEFLPSTFPMSFSEFFSLDEFWYNPRELGLLWNEERDGETICELFENRSYDYEYMKEIFGRGKREEGKRSDKVNLPKKKLDEKNIYVDTPNTTCSISLFLSLSRVFKMRNCVLTFCWNRNPLFVHTHIYIYYTYIHDMHIHI